MTELLGVGILGAGPVTQAIHLPTLATMPDLFRVARVMDIDLVLAGHIADRCGATPTSDAAAVLEDPAVHVVAVCSPNAAHAAQVIAACAAGKRAVLCEKPLAVTQDEAREIGRAARASGTHVVVGAMHVYDPAYREARKMWDNLHETSRFTQSRIFLPMNDVFIDQATELVGPSGPPPERGAAPPAAAILRAGIIGLAIHNLPLVRHLHPQLGQLTTARFVPPFGYELVVAGDDHTIELVAYMGGTWPPTWTLRAVGAEHELRATFPPSYVLAGSARAEIRSAGVTTMFEQDRNGYQHQWLSVHAAVSGETAPLVPLEDAVADIVYALDLADRVDLLVGAPS